MIRLFHRSIVAGVAAFSLLACAASAPAQQIVPPNPIPGTVEPQPPVDQQAADLRADSDLASDLGELFIAANRNEIEMSQFGADLAQDPRVRGFAEHMVKEHQNFSDQLEQALGAGAPAVPGAPGVGQPQAPDAVPGAPGPDLVQVLTEAGDRKLQLVQQDLSQRQGVEFDQAFMGHEVAAHIHMLAGLQTAANHTSGQLRQVIDKGIQGTQDHLNEAKSIMQQLEQTAAQQAAQPGETQRR